MSSFTNPVEKLNKWFIALDEDALSRKKHDLKIKLRMQKSVTLLEF